ncbi:hypothetical protein Y10_10860 [Neptunitalea sp. Y10]|uniref:Uncharacterized protein n=2 Tax=Neptunitalea lumnitzerae TaxID=2965509 RepID=A0ABQ5MH47_9FLAO|nr:hypothetical protein Y10_10860 [Neptunitalea sp. Y10]
MLMNKNIYILHRNDFGIAFMWKKPKKVTSEKIQLIFRDIGFYLTYNEFKEFKQCVADTRDSIADCGFGCYGDCRSLLLRTPLKQLDVAISFEELEEIEDLIHGALFRIQLELYLEEVAKN